MPYIEVWVDDTDCECDGDCDHVEKLVAKFDAIYCELLAGNFDIAMELARVCSDGNIGTQGSVVSEDRLRAWQNLPLPRPAFDTWTPQSKAATQ